ncbi:unnamed protein product [Vitrella brassicaformis CCMP3155]|uniref:Phosphoribosyltransferase domain-containing protein n=2 Tax=Vitrella brassicaformis TaxID=1169539 RepID=A0A0G4GNG4_VITBC|nr:unnamed protein product [Vitrella brassicaformis CCMP3155]|eukprot:CEM31785.1 unnamed protein product [Vitrella brassicaformis CCMP3155]
MDPPAEGPPTIRLQSESRTPVDRSSSASLGMPSPSGGPNSAGKQTQRVVFACPEFEDLADELVTMNPCFVKGKITWGRFEDGFPNISVQDWHCHLRGKHVIFLASFMLEHVKTSIFDQISVIYSVPRSFAKSLTVFLPYFPTGTMERVEKEGQIATAKTLARILSATPKCHGTGPAQWVFFDIHALQQRFYFGDEIIPVLLTAIPLFKDAIAHQSDVAIAFPDEGARKRFGRQFDDEHYELITCSKVRNGDKRMVKITEGDPTGKNVYIVDDLVKTGGTLIQCKKALFEAGAASVSAFVTHGVFPQESWKRFVPSAATAGGGGNGEEKSFKDFFVTDSCPMMSKILASTPPFRVLSLAPAIYNFLKFEDSTKFFG